MILAKYFWSFGLCHSDRLLILSESEQLFAQCKLTNEYFIIFITGGRLVNGRLGHSEIAAAFLWGSNIVSLFGISE